VDLWHLSERDFFADLPAEKEDFLALSKRRDLKKNTIVFTEGDRGDHCYYLEKGSVKVFRATLDGKEPIFSVRKPGEMFGLAEIIDGNDRICTAQTLAGSVVHEIRRADFEEILARYPALAKRVMAVLGRRIRYLCEQMENLMVCDVTSRVARLLVYLSLTRLTNGKSDGEPLCVPFSLTQEDMADMTGSCQQTISETLRRLQDEGYIRLSGREITILRPSEMLRRMDQL
jgi:CRP/FNR family transcriptional regulator, cyclic AMP receptor protein